MKLFRLFVFLISLCLASLALATDYPLTITDDLGREVVLEAEPERIITMLPSHTATLCALGVCDSIVATDKFSNYPAEVVDLPKLGGLFEPNIEKMVVLEPDLVFISAATELAERLESLGLTVIASHPKTYDEVFEAATLYGKIVDREEAAAEFVSQVQAEIEAVTARVAGLESPSVYYELDSTPYSVGPESFVGVLIDKAGGDNIVEASLGDYPQLEPEYIVAADPQVIILADAPFGETAEAVAARPGWGELEAVENERVIELTQEQVDILSRPGPRLAQAVRFLAELFHPEAF